MQKVCFSKTRQKEFSERKIFENDDGDLVRPDLTLWMFSYQLWVFAVWYSKVQQMSAPLISSKHINHCTHCGQSTQSSLYFTIHPPSTTYHLYPPPPPTNHHPFLTMRIPVITNKYKLIGVFYWLEHRGECLIFRYLIKHLFWELDCLTLIDGKLNW